MKLFKKLASLVLVALITFVVVGCVNNTPVSITFEAAKTTLTKGESTNLTVSVTGNSNTAYNFIISDPSLVKIENDVLTVIGDVEEDKAVTVVAYALADASKTATKIFTVKNYVEPKVEITTQRNTIAYGESITLSVSVVGLENKAVAWVVSDSSLVKVDNNVLSVLKEVNADTEVTIKAVSVENQNVYATKKIIVKAPSSFGTISITTSKDTIAVGESVMVSATVTGLQDISYSWKVSHEDLVKIENGILTLIGTVKIDTNVTITATANADESVFKSKTILVKAPVIEGQVGELTTAVLNEIANSSITFGGVLTDYYQDFNNSFNNTTNQYDSLVMMSDGRWYGSWNVKGNTNNIVTDNYRRGATDGLMDAYGNVGHALEKLYIDKNNQVAASVVKDYQSIPAIWEAQHLWNHIGNLQVTNFVYNADDELYTYTVNQNDMEALYLMTYLAYCLTPVLEDTLASVSFKIEAGHITKVILRTELLYYGSDTREDADAMSYTEVELIPTNIGTTVVPEPVQYEAPENAAILAQALVNMQNLESYKYKAVDATTYAPTPDSGDYEISTTSKSDIVKAAVHNYTSSVGTVGEVGYVTKAAILIENTGKYSYAMDDKLYHTEYYGFKQNADGTYDEFEYQASAGALVGTRKVKGSLEDILPTFNFSADIFEFVGTKGTGDSLVYQFKLKATDVTRDLALEVSMHSYADDAEKSSTKTFSIDVNKDGYVVSTSYAYNLSGVYYGNITTTYSNFNSCEIAADTFNTYVPRVWRTSWDQYICKYFQPTHTGISYEENALTVFTHVFGDQVENLPSPQIFLEVFDDLVFGPFFDWKTTTDELGNQKYIDYVSINVRSSEFDENSRITNYEELMNELITLLQEEGYTLDTANTDMSGGATGLRDRYVTMVKGDIEIVISNNHTKHLSIYFYHLGDWILK